MLGQKRVNHATDNKGQCLESQYLVVCCSSCMACQPIWYVKLIALGDIMVLRGHNGALGRGGYHHPVNIDDITQIP